MESLFTGACVNWLEVLYICPTIDRKHVLLQILIDFQQGLVSALCGEENHFTIDGSAAAEGGRPEVIVSGIKDDVSVRLRPVGELPRIIIIITI